MDIVRLREKIVEFTKTDWKKYPTYEHALQEWAERSCTSKGEWDK